MTLQGLCDTEAVLEGIAASKIADFAGEADAADADVLARTYSVQAKRVALLVCLVHTAQARARDDLAEMLCKRMAATAKKAKAKLEEIHLRQRQVVESLIGTCRGVLQGLVPGGPVEAATAPAELWGASAPATWNRNRGGVGAVGVGVGRARGGQVGVGGRSEGDVPAAQGGDLRRRAHTSRLAASAAPVRLMYRITCRSRAPLW
ncbi:MAG TPA: hypothetical protein VM347_35885 [Nonomuraea sp.]|nr:hypothetical protein [Nonomuraea sp.]